MTDAIHYRPEIDGLRAVAVISVLVYHLNPDWLPGGFVGVDVFFVISGYLITSIIARDIAAGQFSLLLFYERRARRILPALFSVMAFVVVVALLPPKWFGLFPDQRADLSNSLIAVPLLGSNIAFWLQSGYFDVASEFKPLLHTWSLAVEEQFYLLFPLALVITFRRPKALMAVIVLTSLASLVAADVMSKRDPTAAFYLPQYRAWELMSGAILALWGARLPAKFRASGAVLGAVLVAASLALVSSSTPFPGRNALAPILGTCLILWAASSGTFIGRALSMPVLQFIGKISYSVYLWHWPIVVFYRLQFGRSPGAVDAVGLAATALAMGYLSWRLVEQPFRSPQGVSRKAIFSGSAMASVAFFAIGAVGLGTSGLADQFENGLSTDQRAIYQSQQYDFDTPWRRNRCFLVEELHFGPECTATTSSGLLVWGDSYAASLYPGLAAHEPVSQFTSSACPPLLGVEVAGRPECGAINDQAFERIVATQPDSLFMMASWRTYPEADEDALAETIKQVRQSLPETRIVVIGNLPRWTPLLAPILLRSDASLDTGAYLANADLEALNKADASIAEAARLSGSTFVSALDYFCVNEQCRYAAQVGDAIEVTTMDYAHLTVTAAIEFAAEIDHTLAMQTP